MEDNVPVGVISSHPELGNLNPADEHTVLKKLADIPEYQTWMKNRLGHLPDVTITGQAGETRCYELTFDGTYVWAGLGTSPVKILKINPVDNTYTVITGDTGENWCIAITFDGTYVWVGLETSPVKLLKINPVDNTYTVITGDTGDNYCYALTFDGTYIWAGLGTSPVKFLKINPVDNTYTVITGASGEDYCSALTFDGVYVWAGLEASPVKLLKINPVDNSYTVITGAGGEDYCYGLIFDGTYIWAGLGTSPVKLLKINPVDNSYTTITGAGGENTCYALTFDGVYVWAGLDTSPVKLLKINPVDNSYTAITGAGGENSCHTLTFDGTYIWAGLFLDPFKILKIFAHRRTMDNISKEYAEAYKFADANKTIIDTVNVFHALQDLTEGLSLGFTWVAGTRGTDITTMATHDGGASTLITTTAAHNLIAGDYITITGTVNYNDSYKVLSAPTGTTFEIDKAWDGNNDATGTYSRGDSYICDSGSDGVYDFSWNITGEPDAINKAYSAAIMVNKSPCQKCRAREYFTKAEYETVPGGAIINVSAGDHICIVIKNVSDTTDITIRHANFRVERL